VGVQLVDRAFQQAPKGKDLPDEAAVVLQQTEKNPALAAGLIGGFRASTAVDIYFDTTDMALAITSGTGAFSGIGIQVPASAVPGTHWVTGVAPGTRGKAHRSWCRRIGHSSTIPLCIRA
jgi:hypothetical protein